MNTIDHSTYSPLCFLLRSMMPPPEYWLWQLQYENRFISPLSYKMLRGFFGSDGSCPRGFIDSNLLQVALRTAAGLGFNFSREVAEFGEEASKKSLRRSNCEFLVLIYKTGILQVMSGVSDSILVDSPPIRTLSTRAN